MKIETVEDVENMVKVIELIQGDAESAHSMEDDLYEAVLRYIADGNQQKLQEIAYTALATKELDFDRWCA